MRKIKTKLHYPVFNTVTPINKNKNNLMSVKNLTDNSADLHIYGVIVDNTDWKWDEYDVMPDDVKEALDQVDGLDKLNIYINSPGGSVFAGLAIYNMLKRNKAKKIVHIDGVAASMASVIALVGDEINMPSNAFMMIHKPLTGIYGNADDLRKIADDLDTIETGLMKSYEENLIDGVDIEQLKSKIADEVDVWLTADEATKYFNIEITNAVEVAASAKHMFENFKNVPKELVASIKDGSPKPKQSNKQKPKPKSKVGPQNKTDEELEKIKLQNELDLLSI